MSPSTGTVVFEDATLKAVELVAETMTLNNFSVSSTTSLQQATNTGNVTTNTVEFTNPTTAFVTTGNVGVGTTSPSAKLHISSGTSGDCVLKIEADTDNNNETDNPRIEFITDGGYNTALVGAGQMPFETANDNALVLAGMQMKLYTGVQDFNDSTGMIERVRILDNGNVGIGTTSPSSKLHIETSSTSSGSVMIVDASSVTNTGYSEIQMIGPGQTLQGLSMFCNGSGRTADGGASATTVRNNNGPIILGNSSYVNRIRNPKDDDFICGKWTTTLDASAATTVITNLRSCVSTPSASGSGMSGNIGRFTAPEDGYYFACCQVNQATRNSSNLLIVYEAGGTNFATNNPDIGTYDEIIDLRSTDNVEETYNKVFFMHMEQNDYIQFRVHSSGAIDSSKLMECYAYLLNRI